MKVQYTFTANLEDMQEIIYQKYNRAYSKNDLSEIHAAIKSGLINKEPLKHIHKLLTNYKDALVCVLQEVEEDRECLESLLISLSGVNKAEESKEESTGTIEEVGMKTKRAAYSIQELSNIVDSLTSMGSNNEQS